MSGLIPAPDNPTSIPGKYQHYKNEDVEDYFIAIGVPYMVRKMVAMSSPVMEITLDGENMTIKTSYLMSTVENTFQLGVEYEENMPYSTMKSVTKMVNDNEVVTESVIPETGAKCGRHLLFTDDECVVTLTHERVQTPGKRYFRKVQQ